MPKIRFLPFLIDKSVPSGSELADIDKRFPLPIAFGCRRGECGVCAIEVLEGENALSRSSPHERHVLAKKGLAENFRLACQCAVNGDVVFRVAKEKG